MKILIFIDNLINTESLIYSLENNNKIYYLFGYNRLFPKRFFIDILILLYKKKFRTLIYFLKKFVNKEMIFIKKKFIQNKGLDFINLHKPNVGIHNMGIIYRNNIIDACGMGILNAHIGKLPEMRGRSVFEWSILLGKEIGVSVFFIDNGIDTGKRLLFFTKFSYLNYSNLSKAKKAFFNFALTNYVKAIKHIKKRNAILFNDISKGKRYYVMSNLMRGIVEDYYKHKVE